MQLISLPLVQHTLRWMWRAISIRVLVLMFLFGALVPEAKPAEAIVSMLPVVIGAQGVGPNIRQDCIDLVLCRPIHRYQFVFSKWVAFMLLAVVACTIQAVVLTIGHVPLPKVFPTFLSLVLTGSISASAGTVCRVLILDPRRQIFSIIATLIFGVTAMAESALNFAGLASFRKILFPAYFTATGGISWIPPHEVILSCVNVVLLLAISCLIIYRQEFSYSQD